MTTHAPTRVTVKGARPYDVVIGYSLGGELPGLLGPGVRRVIVLYPEALNAIAAPTLATLRDAGYEVHTLALPDAEDQKTIQTAARCWAALGQADFTRSDAVVGLGGGATTDLAGFVAASWLRGVKWVAVPTTLAGMVDAAVGGKTGINTDEGKNLVGAFWPPVGVLCDLEVLATLPARDLTAGLAEVVKTGFISDPRILEIVREHAAELRYWAGSEASDAIWAVLAELVERSVAVKAWVVGEDLTEQGLREILNYGHTFGHAIERQQNYRWRHGEAVAVGMVFVAELARLAGLLSDDVVAQHRELLGALGLPTTYDGDFEPLLATMRRDKKARGNTIRFVVLNDSAPCDPPVDPSCRAPGQVAVERLEGPSDNLLRQAYALICR